MSAKKQFVSEILKKLSEYKPTVEEQLIGKVLSITDGVAKISGLFGVSYLEMVEFPHNTYGVAINLEEHEAGVIILGDYLKLKEGDEVKNTGKLLSVPVGEELIGRVIDPLGNPLDGKGEIHSQTHYPVEKVAPGVTKRQPVNVSLATGIKPIDAMIPIGRGQRELIIGDRGIGKTQIALDTIINQKDEKVICIYVAIGQKAARVAQVIANLEKEKALGHTIVVAANSSDPASLQYLAPYAGCAIGEYFMDKGKDVLVVYDDLSKHAWAYREISLILRRPSGREAYPGDVFYLHSRLLERACRLNEKYGGGSLTALPIIETLAGDLSSYIPTNVISITDGQIFLEPDLFYAGMRPAISVGSSVSRVGGAAQMKAMKQVAGKLRLDLAQYRDLAAFVQFASDLDPTTKAQIERGARMTQILKQPPFKPMPVEEQIALLFIGANGYLDDVAVWEIGDFEYHYLEYMKLQQRDILKTTKESSRNIQNHAREVGKKVTMAQERLIRRRIKSAKNIAQITRAMQMVAASKMKKAQTRALSGRPYAAKIAEMAKRFALSVDIGYSPLLKKNTKGTRLIILLSTNKGLCGGLNTTLFRSLFGWFTQEELDESSFVSFGKKGETFLVRGRKKLIADFSATTDMSQRIAALTTLCTGGYIKEEYKEVYLVYNNFLSLLKQEPTKKRILPIADIESDQNEGQEEKLSFLVEPSIESILNHLLFHYIENQIRDAVLEAEASEHSARMFAMKNATDNAKELIDILTLEYNKARQEKITSEIADIVTARLAVE